MRNLAKAAFRIGLSALALYVVFRQINGQQLSVIFRTVNPGWLVAGLGLYVLSKLLSSLRLTQYFRANGIALTEMQNLRLYWVGMYYNLFLPGGIGGDAFKVWFLRRDGAPAGTAFQSVLFDRLSGLFVLGFLALLTTWFSFPDIPWRSTLPIAALATVGGLVAAHYLMARQLVAVLPATTGYALAVQLLQMVCAWTLLKAVGEPDQTGAYLAVFLVSSAVAVLPISIGGVGIRELVFVTASQYAHVVQETAVAFSLLFFLVTAVSSLPGAWVSLPRVAGSGDKL